MKSMKIITSPGDTQRLSNGLPIPGIGYGTYLAPDDTSGTRSILDALEAGYRLIDTASVYGNEKTVGRAVRESSIPREEIFITSKVWNTDQGYESTLSAFDASLNRLETDYLDLYLIHWPIPAGYEKDYKELNRETWKAMERLYKEGQARAIGVSNFLDVEVDSGGGVSWKGRPLKVDGTAEFPPGPWRLQPPGADCPASSSYWRPPPAHWRAPPVPPRWPGCRRGSWPLVRGPESASFWRHIRWPSRLRKA